ncbi:uncharacterized protein DNG_06013 [Cephalotrichum gorgonifer]|uniref:UDP-N-acetylglucosamine transferase subunit ALG14 n=1 Tax=Cephalotrichum gorgonifer TaxID=2041049 RepID=A0AAE8SW17_9PEZI|nr:uncharacterized protein DNG_06013 [Cephalotrichum gorgonifer]
MVFLTLASAFLGAAASALLIATSPGTAASASGLLILLLLGVLLLPVSLACLAIFVGAGFGEALVLGKDYPWETIILTAVLGPVALFVFVERREAGEERPIYALIVLGSGGHTKEMLLMMGNDFRESKSSHRRYLVSSGDTMSLKHLEAFEKNLQDTTDHPGTYDVQVVTRARRVHQSLLSTPISAIQSVVGIIPVLLSRPKQIAPGSPIDLPDVIFTNGPATGFFVGLVAHILRIFYLVPENRMLVLFIESWARVTSLSLTGKLLYYTGIADMFLVQHDNVANKYGVVNAGWLVLPPSRRTGEVVQ